MKTFIKNFNSKNLNKFHDIKTIKNSFNKYSGYNFHSLNYNKNSNKFINEINSKNFLKKNLSYNFSSKISLKDQILNILDPDQVTSMTTVSKFLYKFHLFQILL